MTTYANIEESTIDNYAINRAKIEICKLFPVATLINPKIISNEQMKGFNIYNSNMARLQLALLSSEGKENVSNLLEDMCSLSQNITHMFNIVKTNSGIQKIFNARNDFFSEQHSAASLDAKMRNLELDFKLDDKNSPSQYVSVKNNIFNERFLSFKSMVSNVVNNNFSKQIYAEAEVAWEMGYNSIEVVAPSAINIIKNSLKGMVDVMEEVGSDIKIASLNGLLGLKFTNKLVEVEQKRSLAEFIPSTSQINIGNCNEDNIPFNLKSTLIHEWTHAIDIVSVEQGYPEYATSVSGQLMPDKKIIKVFSGNEEVSNNDFIPVIKSLEDMTVAMYAKNPQQVKTDILKKQSLVLDGFYNLTLGKLWEDVTPKQKEQLESVLIKDVLIKWLSTNRSPVIKGTFIDLLIPILDNELSYKISKAMDKQDFKDLSLQVFKVNEINLDSDYYKHVNKSYAWDIGKMKIKAFFTGSKKLLSEVRVWENTVEDISNSAYYNAPEEMLARQMESSFFPNEINIQKKIDKESQLVYPQHDNVVFKSKAREMISNLEIACKIKPKSALQIFEDFENLREKLDQEGAVKTIKVKF